LPKEPDVPSIDRAEDIDKVIMYFKELFGREITDEELNYLNGIRKKLELSRPEHQPDPRHPEIRWNENAQEWYCIKCGRRSDHIREDDAWKEINAFACEPPTLGENIESEHWH